MPAALEEEGTIMLWMDPLGGGLAVADAEGAQLPNSEFIRS